MAHYDTRMRAIGEWRRELIAARPGRVLLAMWILLGIALAACPAEEPRPHRLALAKDLALKVRFVPDDGPISAGEPVIARMDVTNQSTQAVEVLTGTGGAPALHLTVRAADGQLLASTPRLHGRHHGTGVRTVQPGKTHSVFWILTALCSFEQPGQYEVEVELLDWATRKVLCGSRASLRVEPFDAARLEARCEQIHRSADLSMSVRGKALRSVRHDVALPYLDWMARRWGSKYACLAIRRIGTERAKMLIEALAARKDRVGEAARASLKLDLKTTLWGDVMAN